jgi:hypothetical protein
LLHCSICIIGHVITNGVVLVNTDLTNNSDHIEGGTDESSPRRSLLIRKKERIEHQLAGMDARAREQRRKRDTRLKVIVGAAVLAHARLDPAFAMKLNDVLDRAVVRSADRAFLLGNHNTWRTVEAELTTAGKTKLEKPAPPIQPVRAERTRSRNTGARYEELKQL